MLYVRRGHAYVTPESLTTDGFWVASPPFSKSDSDAPSAELANLLLNALEASRCGVPTPPVSENPFARVLELAGVRSFGTFMKGARAVRLSSDGETVTLTPMRNAGAKGGFEFLEAEVRTVPAEVESVYSAVQMALDAAE